MILPYYITSINTLFGIAAYMTAHGKRYNEDGKNCADVQTGRAQFLTAEVIIFWTTFVFTSFPNLFLIILKKQNLEDALTKKDDDEEGSDKD